MATRQHAKHSPMGTKLPNLEVNTCLIRQLRPPRTPKRRSRFRAHPVLSLHPRMSGGVLASMHGRKLEGGDMGDTIAILLLLTIFLIGICAFLGWYSRRRG